MPKMKKVRNVSRLSMLSAIPPALKDNTTNKSFTGNSKPKNNLRLKYPVK